MAVKTCFNCGEYAMVQETGVYKFMPPANIPGGEIVVQDATWWECRECHETALPAALCDEIDKIWMQRTEYKPKPRKPRKKVKLPKFHFIFHVEEKFFQKRNWDQIYLPGDTRTVHTMLGADSEEEARRKLIGSNMELGVQILSLKLVSCDLWEDAMGE